MVKGDKMRIVKGGKIPHKDGKISHVSLELVSKSNQLAYWPRECNKSNSSIIKTSDIIETVAAATNGMNSNANKSKRK